MGFHTENRDFTQFFVLDQSEKRLWQLGLAADVLREAVSILPPPPLIPSSSPFSAVPTHSFVKSAQTNS